MPSFVSGHENGGASASPFQYSAEGKAVLQGEGVAGRTGIMGDEAANGLEKSIVAMGPIS